MIKKRITIDYEGNLGERLKESARQNKRSINQQVQYLLEEALLFDEKFHSLPDDQRLLILKTARDMIEKMAKDTDKMLDD